MVPLVGLGHRSNSTEFVVDPVSLAFARSDFRILHVTKYFCARPMGDRKNLVPLVGLEPTTSPLGRACSIQLSYKGINLMFSVYVLAHPPPEGSALAEIELQGGITDLILTFFIQNYQFYIDFYG